MLLGFMPAESSFCEHVRCYISPLLHLINATAQVTDIIPESDFYETPFPKEDDNAVEYENAEALAPPYTT